MRNATAAEWILTLTTTNDRAASTVGDLLEEASSRGGLWFWSSVLRTASSHLWRGLRAAPLRIVGLAFSGLLAYLVLFVCLGFFESAVWKWVYYGSGGDQSGASAANPSILVKFIRDRLDLSRTEGTRLAA
jgi:hypothetical protein